MILIRLLVVVLLAAAGTAGLRSVLLVIGGGAAVTDLSGDRLAGYVLSDVSQTAALALAAALSIEIVWMGWHRSSLRRLVVGSKVRLHMDVVMLCLAVLGFQAALASFLTAGLWERASELMNASASRGPLAAMPAWIAAPLIYLAISFVNYWTHRALHSKLLWPLHAVHHAAPAFTVANAGRIALPEMVATDLLATGAAAALGGSAEALYWAFLVAGIESIWTHTNIRGVEWLERFGFNSPKGHLIHHALDARYHNRNFGDLLCIWDKVFGTHMPSAEVADDLAVGVEDPRGIYYSDHPLRDWLLPQWCWAKDLCVAGWTTLVVSRKWTGA